MMSPDTNGWSVSRSGLPVDIPEDDTPTLMLSGGRMVSLDPPLVRALRLYVGEYVRIYGRKRFLGEFGVAASVLQIWEDDYVGYSIPRRVLDHLGPDLHGVMSAAEELRGLDTECGADANDDSDSDGGWVSAPYEEVPRVVRVRPRPAEESTVYGTQVAHLMDRWRNLRGMTSSLYDKGKEDTGDYLFYRDILLTEVEPRLISRGMRLMGGGSGHRLDEILWNTDGVREEVRMREVARADVRARRHRSLLNRIRDWFRRDVTVYGEIPEG